jgi:predicted MFS family arabinose efflux permease
MDINQPDPRHQRMWSLLGAFVGALVFFGASFLLYTWLNPILEARSDWLRETQGFLFNMVPAATLIGGALGWWVARRGRR